MADYKIVRVEIKNNDVIVTMKENGRTYSRIYKDMTELRDKLERAIKEVIA